MRFTGTVAEFNRSTGRGLVSSKAAGGKVALHISQVVGSRKLDVGDFVEFELGVSEGVPQALSVTLTTRMAVMQQRAVDAQSSTVMSVDDMGFLAAQSATQPYAV